MSGFPFLFLNIFDDLCHSFQLRPAYITRRDLLLIIQIHHKQISLQIFPFSASAYVTKALFVSEMHVVFFGFFFKGTGHLRRNPVMHQPVGGNGGSDMSCVTGAKGTMNI